MSATEEWAFPDAMQPRSDDLLFDLDSVLDAVVLVRSEIPEDAFTAEILGTERTGNGVVIQDGVVLTIGYIVTEAQSVWLTTNSGMVVQGYPLAYDQATGFGLVRALGPMDAKPLAMGSAADLETGENAFVIGHGGLDHSLKVKLVDKREFAGYWEYLLDEALFTAPAHPQWGGAALIGQSGLLLGIGSLLVQEAVEEQTVQGNMIVPIDILQPILDTLLTTGVSGKPARAWLGLYANEADDKLFVAGTASHGPAAKAKLHTGDEILRVADTTVTTLAGFLRAVWELGPAGTSVPLTVARDGEAFAVEIESVDRNALLKGPQLH